MKIYCTTSNKYLHLLKVYTYLFNKFWSEDQEVIIVGYNKPTDELPSNFKFHSLGEQIGGPKMWATDLRKFFESIEDEHFIWSMEDTFLTSNVDIELVNYIEKNLIEKNLGRFGLTEEVSRRGNKPKTDITLDDRLVHVIKSNDNTEYRLSCQISIWSKEFLLKYLKPGLDPWEFETQHPNGTLDNKEILGIQPPTEVMKINEGVRYWDINKLNLKGLSSDIINDMKIKKLI